MTILHLKSGKPDAGRAQDAAEVVSTVEAILKDIEMRGDAARRMTRDIAVQTLPGMIHGRCDIPHGTAAE